MSDDSLDIEALAEDFLARQRRGEEPSIEEYARRYPHLADEIRELFPAMTAMEKLKIRGERSSDGRASLGPVKLERLGDFRIIREIGRGGMGLVYEAEQESLGRRVALKVLPRQALLEERHLARFKREAQIASRLHHTNIVQVYGVGEQEGFHYYVMQYVRGEGLDRVITYLTYPPDTEPAADAGAEGNHRLLRRICEKIYQPAGDAPNRSPLENPDYYRTAARIAIQAAEALAYAHSQGTLHRDIKPANLLLDDEGVVWVADFGLARATCAPQVTLTGDLTGTLRYLAPERLSGHVDERCDIYALGLTLYELLTLHPGFDDADQSTLIHRISEQSPLRPRKINPAIPRDLETIVLKAIAREPEHRYASAAAMAEDLRRFLEDRPVLARRIGPIERMWRWCRRNRAVAILSLTSMTLLYVVAAVAAIGYIRTSTALDREAIQRQRAEAVARLARDAVDRVFERLGPMRSISTASLTIGDSNGASVEIPRQVVQSKETASLMEEMLPFYDRLARQSGEELALHIRAADATRRIGDIRQRLGQYDLAETAYRKAIEMYQNLAAGQNDGKPLLTAAETCNELGKTLRLAGKTEASRQAHQQALALLEPPAIKTVPLPVAKLELARTYYLLGVRVPPNPGMRPPGLSEERPLTGPLGRPLPPPGRSEGLPPRPGTRTDAGATDPSNEAEQWARRQNLNKAVGILKDLLAGQPDNPSYRHLLALCYREMPPRGGPAGPAPYDNAVEILSGLVKDYPLTPEYRFDLCETFAAVDSRGQAQNREDLARVETRLKKALELSQELLRQQPNVPEYLASQSHIYHKLGEVTRKLRHPDEAIQNNRKAVEIQTALAREFPQVETYQVWLSAFRNSLADILIARGNSGEARPLLETNIAQTEKLLKANPSLWYLHTVLMDDYRSLASILEANKETEPAARATQAAQEHSRQLRPAVENRPADMNLPPGATQPK